jgi:hypothetical protein
MKAKIFGLVGLFFILRCATAAVFLDFIAVEETPPVGPLIASAISPGAFNNPETPPVNTTTANLIIVAVSAFPGDSPGTLIVDTYANTWVPLTRYATGAQVGTQLFYCINPTVGAGHWFRNSGTNFIGCIGVAAFVLPGTITIDQADGHQGLSEGTPDAGTITPTTTQSLAFSSLAWSQGEFDTPAAISSMATSFTILQQRSFQWGSHLGLAFGWRLYDSTSALTTEYVTSVTVGDHAAAIANWKY